jgi:transmembrane sensor
MEDNSSASNDSEPTPDSKPNPPKDDMLSLLVKLSAREDQVREIIDKEWVDFQVTEPEDPTVKNFIFNRIKNEMRPSKSLLPSLRNSATYKIAASVALLLSFSAILLYYAWPQLFNATGKNIVLNAKIGEVRKYTLPDSSYVWLNSGSSLAYVSTFKERKVILTGEAYFEVKKLQKKSFEVHTGSLKVMVLGTSFTVNSFNPITSEIMVAEGRVRVESPTEDESVTLTKGQAVKHRAVAGKGFSPVQEINENSVAAWVDDVLIFDDRTFEEVAQILERRFGVYILLQSDALKKCELTGRHKGESLDTILNSIKFVLGCSFLRTGDRIVVKGTGC